MNHESQIFAEKSMHLVGRSEGGRRWCDATYAVYDPVLERGRRHEGILVDGVEHVTLG